VRQDAFYGWPYSYFGRNQDPRQVGKRPDLVAAAVKPDYALGAHTASLGLVFYRGSAFPTPYRSGAYIGQHGSWNRSRLGGYRVMFVPFTDGRPSGPAQEFLGGFIADSGRSEVYGRPLGVALLPDGSLIVADDPANRIWRVWYSGAAGQRGSGAVITGDSAVKVATVDQGLLLPEGMKWDADQRVWFVSNINAGQQHDNNGFISRLSAEGKVENLRFIAGGAAGVTLHGPKGMAIAGDTLWVTDLDAVRGFNRRTGAPVAVVDFQPFGALFLNDITVGPEGALYITDSGVRFDSAGTRTHIGPDRIFRIRGREPSVALETPALVQPNGIIYDRSKGRFLLAPIAGDSAVQQWKEGSAAPEDLARGPGRYDGIELLPDGRILVSAWHDSTVSEVVGKRIRPLIRGVPAPADIGVDPVGRIVGVPMVLNDRVELWRLPGK
jgi:sugar lactone lactonase YvrE